MMGFRVRDSVVPMAVPSTPEGIDLSRYRGFQFGMSLLAVAKQIRVETSDARVLHERPAVILELAWQPPRYRDGNSVQEILFGFYEGELFRMDVRYDQSRTEGLTVDDMIEAVSEAYGRPTSPAAEMLFPSVYNENVKVLARWEDSKYSFGLLKGTYKPAFAMVMLSKELNAMAEAAAVESRRLDKLAAPQLEADRQAKDAAEWQARQEKARQANKESFRI